MSREFTRDSVTKFLPAQFPWIWCKCLLRILIHSKIFNLDKYKQVLINYSLLIMHAVIPIWIWHQLRERILGGYAWPVLTVKNEGKTILFWGRKGHLGLLKQGRKKNWNPLALWASKFHFPLQCLHLNITCLKGTKCVII